MTTNRDIAYEQLLDTLIRLKQKGVIKDKAMSELKELIYESTQNIQGNAQMEVINWNLNTRI